MCIKDKMTQTKPTIVTDASHTGYSFLTQPCGPISLLGASSFYTRHLQCEYADDKDQIAELQKQTRKKEG
jgi:hypothetical protein